MKCSYFEAYKHAYDMGIICFRILSITAYAWIRFAPPKLTTNGIQFRVLAANLKCLLFSLNLRGIYPTTQKQLIIHLQKYVGLTPKYYHRILRFNEILKKVAANEKISWADVVYSCDYSDQSHFIKEFFLFSGFNPQAFIKMDFNKDQTNFFPMDKKG